MQKWKLRINVTSVCVILYILYYFLLHLCRAVKEMIKEIIRKANSPFPPEPGHVPDGQYIAEMMIPGPKVGLLIGKGGENIRNLQVNLKLQCLFFFSAYLFNLSISF